MKHTFKQIFHSGKFVLGFCIFMALLLLVIIYPIIVTDDPLAIIGQGTFFPPGIYVNSYDSIDKPSPYILNLPDAAAKRIVSKLSESDRQEMKDWLLASGIPENEIDTTDTAKLMEQWETNYDPAKGLGMTYAKQRYYQRLDKSISGLLSPEGKIIAAQNPDTGILEQVGVINQSDYVNVGEVANVRVLMLGTDNFGRDMLTQLVKAIGVSLQIGIVAGLVATAIGLTLGLLSGYIGGWVDDVVMFFTNLFTVIPSFVLLVLISFSIGQDKRGATTIAIVIGLTSWVWTTRSVRASVISLRNRDHVNLSKLSGHSIVHIIINDILPYIASYVIMALILQISAGILTEAGLSILGLGPRTTEVPTLGLMMNWAMIYQAHILGKWWAYLPVLVAIALITFSMNLMNTGLDQIFNPALRE
ncbi:MAG TPA: ABC transporter permease [Anaerolineaceae bacterium]|jgi:peptide/nickel transport system permease protein|nr:ABC transporter permease [Longilinea sp.]HOU44968.1 ABC transporter permease [Anaerolineaceae bacterium]HQF46208.1 ABC transporter permease [Anaerolineaceae bacterium]HQH36222.1 ABC transporter permease [Anaerolineaceae bacterium]HQJ04249.1 ABC transporter permease [Anaerolineaceae bacterium]